MAGPGGRGAFIVFEGVDRSGKSTQCQKLVSNLQASGVDAELWRFPDRNTATGKLIDSYLRSQSEMDDGSAHLLFAANRWEKRQSLLSKLQKGTTLIVDRYAFSGAVYTAAKRTPGLDLDWCKAPDKGLPAPDAVLYLDLSMEAASQRGGFGNERYENEEMQHEVRRLFGAIQNSVPYWQTIDADRPIDDLSQQIEKQVLAIINMCKSKTEMPEALWT